MPRLLLVRHAESVRHTSQGDRERPLTPQGRADAVRMGAHFRDQHLHPDLALVSPARRARETLDAIVRELPQKVACESEEALYNADTGTLTGLIARTGQAVETLLVVGHNPGLCDLARSLVESAPLLHFPAPCLAVIRLSCASWSEICAGSGRLDYFISFSSSPMEPVSPATGGR